MRVQIQAVNFNIDKDLNDLINNKVKGLLKFYDNIVEAQVYLKVQKTSQKENKDLEIRLGIPGDDPVVKKTESTFELALNQSIAVLKKTLIKIKEKQRKND
jgi:putative sigma-54 modulation protein